MKVTGILLAAGEGKRFGGGKLLALVDDHTPVCIAALRNLAACVDDVVAVVRPGDESVKTLLQQNGATVVVCDNAREGMGASLSCGVRASAAGEAWVVALADMPLIKPESIRAVADALRGGAAIVTPVYRGERGHPVGFAATLRDELEALGGDAGAREIIKRRADQVVRLELDDRGILIDIDTREQLAQLADADARKAQPRAAASLPTAS